MQKNQVKINLKGGILSTGVLSNILAAARHCGSETIHFGERQNAFFFTTHDREEVLEKYFNMKSISVEINENQYPNITSSYIAEDIFTTHPWVSEGMYQDILNSIDYKTKFKINIVDPTQGLVPLFTGNLNFICSMHMNFWYLFVKHHSIDGMMCYPTLIYTNDIGALSLELEKELTGKKNVNLMALAKQLNEQHKFIVADIERELSLQRVRFPDYEGLHRLGDKFLLGIYRRNNDFSVEFLEEVTTLCNQARIGQICVTPWQSLLIKGIEEKDRIQWEKLLGKFGINIRHSALELNWQLPDLDEAAMALKKFLVREFDERDIRTHGLSFAIKTNAMDVASSVVIEEKIIRMNGSENFNTQYSVLYAEDFNPNKQIYTVYSENIEKAALPDVLERLSRKYYEQLNNSNEVLNIDNKEEKQPKVSKTIYQCKHCFTLYDAEYGDSTNGISSGILFNDLPATYVCPVCDGPKTDFIVKELSLSGQ
jgi:rubredoxin/sulfite reductase beta subunit-like hemoprotein